MPKPPTPNTATDSPFFIWAVVEIAAQGVETASGIIAACSKGKLSGIFSTRDSFAITYSA